MVDSAFESLKVYFGLVMGVDVMITTCSIMHFFFKLEISDYLSSCQGLAITIVFKAQVGHPDILEGLQVFSSNWKHMSIQNPINYISTRRIGEGALIVVKLFAIVLVVVLEKLI